MLEVHRCSDDSVDSVCLALALKLLGAQKSLGASILCARKVCTLTRMIFVEGEDLEDELHRGFAIHRRYGDALM